jgi:hypothetical protein
VCTFIGTRDLVQEHIAYRVWSLVNDWEMPKEAATRSSQGGLVYLKYTFRYRDQFDEPNDEWLNCIEATSDELFGDYTRAEDDAMTLAFGGRGKKRLNRVFDITSFIYPDYSYPSRKYGKKRKATTLAISTVPKGKKIKVLMHRPRYIETARVPKLGEGTSSTTDPRYLTIVGSKGESAEVLEVIGQEKPESAGAPKHPAEAKEKAAEEPELGESAGLRKILSPPPEPELPKVPGAPAITPKRRRMASVLDAVLESTRASKLLLLQRRLPKLLQLVLKPKLGPQCPLKQSLLELDRVLNKDLRTSVWFWRKKTRPRRLNLRLPKRLLKS